MGYTSQIRLFAAVLLGSVALPCAFGMALANEIPPKIDIPSTLATQQPAGNAVTGQSLPVASQVRIAGDQRQTRFIMDLDGKIPLRAFALAGPNRIVIDLPQVDFKIGDSAGSARGLIKAFRFGMVMPGGSRVVFDLAGPARIKSAVALDAAHGQPARLVVELEAVDQTTFAQSVSPADDRPALRPGIETTPAVVNNDAAPAAVTASATPVSGAPSQIALPVQPLDTRPVIVIDPGHGGIDNGTHAGSMSEKTLVLTFGQALRDQLEKSGKYRVVMTRDDDTFVALGERVNIARRQSASLFLSIHADALPRGEGDARGATIYTLSDRASDTEAQRLADSENKADAIGGVNLTEEPTEVADILIDLAQRETRTFSGRFARILMGEMKTSARMHKQPLKSAGFRVLKAPDVPSVLLELGYVSNKDDLELLLSDSWRVKAVASIAQAIDMFLAKRIVSAAPDGG